MKKTKHIINSLIIISIFFFSAYTNISAPEIPWENGMLNGNVSVTMNQTLNKVSERTIEGQYKGNQKVGTWKLWDKNKKLLQERKYKNNYEYSIIVKDKSIPASYTLKRDKDNLYEYATIDEKDIAFASRVWKIIPEKELYNNPMLSMIIQRIDLSDFQAYTSYELTIKDSTNKAQTLDFTQIRTIRIMGDWFYDTKRKLSEYRILAISPIIDSNDKEFWYYYPEIRKSLSVIEAESENRMVQNLEDILFFGEYPSLIYKIESVEDTEFEKEQYQKQTLKAIENHLMIEASLWTK